MKISQKSYQRKDEKFSKMSENQKLPKSWCDREVNSILADSIIVSENSKSLKVSVQNNTAVSFVGTRLTKEKNNLLILQPPRIVIMQYDR